MYTKSIFGLKKPSCELQQANSCCSIFIFLFGHRLSKHRMDDCSIFFLSDKYWPNNWSHCNSITAEYSLKMLKLYIFSVF